MTNRRAANNSAPIPGYLRGCTRTRKYPGLRRKISWGQFRHQTENQNCPLTNPPPPILYVLRHSTRLPPIRAQVCQAPTCVLCPRREPPFSDNTLLPIVGNSPLARLAFSAQHREPHGKRRHMFCRPLSLTTVEHWNARLRTKPTTPPRRAAGWDVRSPKGPHPEDDPTPAGMVAGAGSAPSPAQQLMAMAMTQTAGGLPCDAQSTRGHTRSLCTAQNLHTPPPASPVGTGQLDLGGFGLTGRTSAETSRRPRPPSGVWFGL